MRHCGTGQLASHLRMQTSIQFTVYSCKISVGQSSFNISVVTGHPCSSQLHCPDHSIKRLHKNRAVARHLTPIIHISPSPAFRLSESHREGPRSDPDPVTRVLHTAAVFRAHRCVLCNSGCPVHALVSSQLRNGSWR